jgi:hypothetical protein
MIDRQSALLHCAKGGQIMKKLALALLVVAFAASPAAAASKKKAKPYGMTYEQAMKANQESWEIVKQGLPWCCRAGRYRSISAPTWMKKKQ